VEGSGIHHLELIILFLLVLVTALAMLARRFRTPYPIVLVIGGLIISLIPHLPHISLRPDVVFLVFLPPLLYVGAINTSWRDFRANIFYILMLALGLVIFTVLGVALGAGWILPGFDYRVGAVLGAVVSTTDAIAATAIAKRVGLPQRIIDILEGESLVNDASGLLALQFTVTLVVTGQHPPPGLAIFQFLWLCCGGIALGLGVAYVVDWISLSIIDAPIEITLSLLTPYLAYLVAEGIGASGVLATVACGLYLGHKHSETFSVDARLESSAVWRTIDFVLNGIVFMLIGLQLPFILKSIRFYSHSISRPFYGAFFFVGFVILLRLVWTFSGAWATYWVRTRLLRRLETPPGTREVFLVGWTGMRGVLALAAAISLPEVLANGAPFPNRSLIVFLTFTVIFSTLVLQGLTLPALIRKLGLNTERVLEREETEARRTILTTVLDYINQLESQAKPEHLPIYQDIARHYKGRLALIEEGQEEAPQQEEIALARYYGILSKELLGVERRTALRLRNEDKINDEVLRRIEREIDLTDARSLQS
jgi:CPA1 family monovalent cation:H+ antiporter